MIIDNWSIPRVLYIQYLDVVSGRALIDNALQQSGDERFDDLRFIISDWSQVLRTEVSTLDVQELIACLIPMSKLCPNVRHASVVKRNDTGVGLAAWYRHLAYKISWDIDIFHNTEEAFLNYSLDYRALKQDEQSPDVTVHPADAPKDILLAKSPAPNDY